MPDFLWFRLYTDMIDNEKIRLLAFEDRWHFIGLLCLKQQGVLDDTNLRDRKIAIKLGVKSDTLDEIKRRLIEVGLINSDWLPIGWQKHQFVSDSAAGRMKKYRENKKLKKQNVTVTSPLRNSDVPDTDTDTESEYKIKTSCDRVTRTPFDSILNIFHTKLPHNPKVMALSKNRKAQIKARWLNDLKTIPQWENYFDAVSTSKFLTGRVPAGNGRAKPFIASIDFLIKESNMIKIAEGFYND